MTKPRANRTIISPLMYEEEMRIFSKAMRNVTPKEQLSKDDLLDKVALVREEMLILHKKLDNDDITSNKYNVMSNGLRNICHVLMIEHMHAPSSVHMHKYGEMLDKYADSKCL